MRVRRPPLRSLTVFEAAARHGSFLRAGNELFVTTSAVSHHIKALETFLGLRLFDRLSRGVRLTEEGVAYYRTVQAALDKIDEGTGELLHARTVEVLTIRCGVSFAIRWLMPRLPLFLLETPQIDVKILTQNTPPSTETAVDLEIKYGHLHVDDGSTHIKPLIEEDIVPLCSPALLRSGQPIRGVEDLRNFRLIESERSIFTWSSWMTANRVAGAITPRLRFDNSYLATQAAVAGLGVALEGNFLASDDLASGRLVVPPSLRETAVRRPLRFLVVPEVIAGLDRVVLFKEWLSRTIRREQNAIREEF